MAAARVAAALRRNSARALRFALSPVTHAGLAVQFRRLRIVHPENVPPTGALLLLANHPSTWMDVLLLGLVLRREFHFLSQEEQFRPWPRGMLLHAYGTLPLSSREHRGDAVARNERTFRRCEQLFDRGEAVAVFPEGISRLDRGLMPLKHGAARLALSYVGRRNGRQPLALVPVGIHYSDRTAFRSDVTVTIGAAIEDQDLCPPLTDDAEEAARRLTERMTEAMSALVLGIDGERVRPFAVLEALASSGRGSLDLWHARRLARSLVDLEHERPEAFARVERRVAAFERLCAMLRVQPSALVARPGRARAGSLAMVVAGAIPAVAGFVLHSVPALLTHFATERYRSEASRVAFARLTAGTLFYSLTLGVGGAFLLAVPRVPFLWLPVAWCLFAILGLFALRYGRDARLEFQRWRLTWLSRRHPRLVRGARRLRKLLLDDLERLRS
jgi:1-acyl-sn-glycerol-3-phosphate acyltransferase